MLQKNFVEQDNNQTINQDNNSFFENTNVRKLSYKMRFWRWVILGLIALFIFSNTMCSSIMGSLQEQIIKALETDYDGYNMLAASFSLPNIINPFIAGIVIDIIGARLGLIGYSTFLVIGMIIQYIATTIGSYYLMMAGIIFFSIGTASMAIIIPPFISVWFIGQQLSLGLGAIAAASNLGVVLTNLTLPPLYQQYQTVTIPYLVCAIVQGIGYVSVYGIFGIDYKSEKDDQKRQKILQQQVQAQEQKKYLENQSFESRNSLKNEEEEIQEKKTNRISFKDFKKLKNLLFWLIVGVGIFQNISMFYISANLQHILIKFYDLDEVGVGRIISAMTLAAGLLSPFFAHITDKIGRRAECFILSSILQCITLLCWMFIPFCQNGGCYWFYLPIILNGLGTSITAAAYYPAVTLVVDQKVIGSSFGFSDCFKSLGLFLMPFVFGPIMKYGQRPQVNSYFWIYALSLLLSIIALIFSILVFIQDKRNGNRLNLIQGEYEQKKNIEETIETQETNISMTILN